MILGEDGQKLSKRHGAVSVMDYKDQGYLPEAIKNYLARLGWSHGDDEIFDMNQFCEWFDLDHITSSSAQFSKDKLDWLNNHYIKTMNLNDLMILVEEILISKGFESVDKERLGQAINLYRERENNLNQLAQNIEFFFKAPEIKKELIELYFEQNTLKLLSLFFNELNNHDSSEESINHFIKDFVKMNEIKFPLIAMPLRVILVGADQSPSVGSIISILSTTESLRRFENYLK